VQTVDRALDSFEADSDLQRRTGAMYRLLAAQEYLSPWTVLGPEADGSLSIPAELAG
jgi:dTMP kinase